MLECPQCHGFVPKDRLEQHLAGEHGAAAPAPLVATAPAPDSSEPPARCAPADLVAAARLRWIQTRRRGEIPAHIDEANAIERGAMLTTAVQREAAVAHAATERERAKHAADLERRTRGERALQAENEKRRETRCAFEDARRTEIEERMSQGKSYQQIASYLGDGWTKTKVAEAHKRWQEQERKAAVS